MASELRTYTTLCLLTLFAGCNELSDMPDTDPVCVWAEIGNQSRTSMTGTTAQFTAGDNIGVFETLTGRSNVPYIYGSPAWSSKTPIYWRNETASHRFYAYYPYTASSSGLRAGMPVLSTQNIATTPGAAWDMLVAGPLNQTRAANVPLVFSHAFAMIQLNISMGILIINPTILNRITVRGGNPTGAGPYGIVNITGNPAQVGYDLSTKTVWAATNDAQSYAQVFYSDVTGTTLLNTAITYYMFVLPGSYTNPKPAVSLRTTTLLVTTNTAYANFTSTNFQAGMKYVYNLSIGLATRSAEPQIALVPQEIVPFGDITVK